MSTLIVILPTTAPSAATSCEVVITDAERKVLRHTEAPLALLPAAAGAEIVAVVPVQKLSWHQLKLPRGTLARGYRQERTAPRLRAVLDGLLEDRLLDEPSQLHYALEPQAGTDRPVWVAVCDRPWLQAWLAALEQAGRPVTRIVPELAPPASDAPSATVLQVIGTPDRAQILHSGPGGVSLLPLTTATAALVSGPPSAGAPDSVLAEPGVAALAEQHFKRSVTLQTRHQRAAAAAQSAWDLAQFELLRTRGTRLRKRLSTLLSSLLHAPQWRAARWALGVLVAVNLAGVLAMAWQEREAQSAKRAAIREILVTTFPDVRVVVDAPLQMARALADLQRQSGTASNADMETMLAQFQTAAVDAPPAAAIEFSGGELQLKGLDPAAAPLADVVSRLRAQGYSARWQEDTLLMKPEANP